ncbi:hypothetical protein MIR68_003357 [Amoeboaphelidium protococcarum]|nr:hypothetical protein MIR68_003357 [Amoeboaphelidium protococcarum]
MEKEAITVENLSYSYGGPKVLDNVNLHLPYGARCLLVGANGAGKSTLLRVLAGKRLVHAKVQVMGRDAYSDTPDEVQYLGAEFIQNPIVHGDVVVSSLLKSMGSERYGDRVQKLIQILDVNVEWHMNEISDGERRRVQILMGLLKPFQVLLQDEVTVDLDVIVRRNLLDYLKNDCNQATVIYATHIFDGLGDWPTHIAHIRSGTIIKTYQFANVMQQYETQFLKSDARQSFDSPLLTVVESWLREDFKVAASSAAGRRGRDGKTQQITELDRKGEDAAKYGDKFYNYWKNSA